MNCSRIGLIGIMLSLLSNLFGCKEVEISGPDFTDTIFKVVHIEPGFQVAYEIPGNMSKLMNFAEKYKTESPRSYKVQLSNENDFELDHWRLSHEIDGAMWDYHGAKNKGLGGDLGTLNFQLSLDRTNDGKELQEFILQSYDDFLNGPNGLNTTIRNSEMGKEKANEELGHWIIKSPDNLESLSFNGKEFLHFSVLWRAKEYYYFYIMPVSEDRFLTFQFRLIVNANSDQEYSEQRGLILQDINTIIKKVVIE